MSRILSDLYNGNLEPYVKLGENDPKVRGLERLISKNLEKLELSLCKEDREMLEKYNESCTEYECVIIEKAFMDGFCLATRIVAEAMCFSEKQFTE